MTLILACFRIILITIWILPYCVVGIAYITGDPMTELASSLLFLTALLAALNISVRLELIVNKFLS